MTEMKQTNKVDTGHSNTRTTGYPVVLVANHRESMKDYIFERKFTCRAY